LKGVITEAYLPIKPSLKKQEHQQRISDLESKLQEETTARKLAQSQLTAAKSEVDKARDEGRGDRSRLTALQQERCVCVYVCVCACATNV
jgi:capsule polysaccharide export protein KpsE/RkpR